MRTKIKLILCMLTITLWMTGCVSQDELDEVKRKQEDLEYRIEKLENQNTSSLDFDESEKDDTDTTENQDNEMYSQYPSYVEYCDRQYSYQGEDYERIVNQTRGYTIDIDIPEKVSVSSQGCTFLGTPDGTPGIFSINLLVTNNLPYDCDISDLLEQVTACQNGYCLKYTDTDSEEGNILRSGVPTGIKISFEMIDQDAPVYAEVLCKYPSGNYITNQQVFDKKPFVN